MGTKRDCTVTDIQRSIREKADTMVLGWDTEKLLNATAGS